MQSHKPLHSYALVLQSSAMIGKLWQAVKLPAMLNTQWRITQIYNSFIYKMYNWIGFVILIGVCCSGKLHLRTWYKLTYDSYTIYCNLSLVRRTRASWSRYLSASVKIIHTTSNNYCFSDKRTVIQTLRHYKGVHVIFIETEAIVPQT